MNTKKNQNYGFIPNFSNHKHPIQPNSPSISQLQALNTSKYAKNITYDKPPKKGINSNTEIIAHYGGLTINGVIGNFHFNEITSKIFSLVIIKYHETKETKIEFSLNEYKRLTHTRDSKNAKDQIINAIDSLINVSVTRSNFTSLNSRQRKLEPFYRKTNLFTSGGYGKINGYKRGIAVLNLTDEFAYMLDTRTTPRIYPKVLFRLRGTAYYLLNALLNNKQINYTKTNNRGNRIKMKTLLKQCPNLPNWSNIYNRNYTSRVVDSLAGAINSLKDLCKMQFSFLTADGDNREEIKSLPLDNFLESQLVVTNWGNLNVDQIGDIRKRGQRKD